jgi:hypothetical protein
MTSVTVHKKKIKRSINEAVESGSERNRMPTLFEKELG